MSRTFEQIREQEQLVISPQMLRSDRATVYGTGAMLSAYSYETGDYAGDSDVIGAILWLWLCLVATAAALWWLQQGAEVALYLVALATGLVVHALAYLARMIHRRRKAGARGTLYVLSVSVGNDHTANFFESGDKAEVEAVRAEIERVFALEAS